MSQSLAPTSSKPSREPLGFVLYFNLTIGWVQIKDASKRLKHRLLT